KVLDEIARIAIVSVYQLSAPLARARSAARHTGLHDLDQLRVRLTPPLLSDLPRRALVALDVSQCLRDDTAGERLAGELVLGVRLLDDDPGAGLRAGLDRTSRPSIRLLVLLQALDVRVDVIDFRIQRVMLGSLVLVQSPVLLGSLRHDLPLARLGLLAL